jgi:very-short-patch-repair endonuclease
MRLSSRGTGGLVKLKGGRWIVKAHRGPRTDGRSLFIELDVFVHEDPTQRAEDARRDLVLSEIGTRIVRFNYGEVREDLDGVLKKIRELVADAPSS